MPSRLSFSKTYYEAYATSFSGTENPMVEDGLWLHGAVDGTSWTNIRTAAGKAYGTQTGTKPPYDDSCAYRRARSGRIWSPNQDVRGRVFLTSRAGWGGGFHEVELQLRGSISSGVNKCYEIVFSMNAGTTYCEITQWRGPFATDAGDIPASYAFLESNTGFTAPANGDWVRATIIGTTIRAYTSTNGTSWTECSDPHDISGDAEPLATGLPGFGHWKNDAADVASTYGFSQWIAQAA